MQKKKKKKKKKKYCAVTPCYCSMLLTSLHKDMGDDGDVHLHSAAQFIKNTHLQI